MTDTFKQDLEKLLKYNWEDEKQDYIDHHGAKDLYNSKLMEDCHIFTTMTRLSDWLEYNA